MWKLFSNYCHYSEKIGYIIHSFVVSICIHDIVNLELNNTLVTSSYLLGKWPKGQIGCELSTHFTVIYMGSSLWHTALVAIHRLVVVVFNILYKKISRRNTQFSCVLYRCYFYVNPRLVICRTTNQN